MTRIGSNPARGKRTAYRPAAVTAAMLTCIPNLDGYFRSKLDVVKLSLASLIAHTPPEADLLVFDNGSCPELVDHLRRLRDAGEIDYLLLSSGNVGKIAALRMIFDAAPGEWVAYTDDDVLFYPGWLDAHKRIFETFDGVGMVSGAPVRNANTYANRTLENLVQNHDPGRMTILTRRFIQDEWETDWARSTGRDPEKHLLEQAGRHDVALESGGIRAIGGANHFQFMARKSDLKKALPVEWTGMLMGQMVELDEAVDRLGLLRLSTSGRFTRHIGNVLEEDLRREALEMGLDPAAGAARSRRKRHWMLYVPGMGRLLHWVYNRLFKIVNEIP